MMLYVIRLNPEPWAIGTAYAARVNGKMAGRMSPNIALVAYKEAVKEEMAEVEMLPEDYRRLTFYFWRRQDAYLDSGDRRRHRNQADATNMQKALEDALQGVLYPNDREIVDIRSRVIAQGPNVEPCIVVTAERVNPDLPVEVTHVLFEELRKERVPKSDNSWPPKG